MPGVNLIFLDIDGVLNTTDDQRKMHNENYWVQEGKMDMLIEIVQATDAKIVLSSTWRFHADMVEYIKEEMTKSMSMAGIWEDPEAILISKTPDLSEPSVEPTPIPEAWHQTRTDEILLWLKENAIMELGEVESDHKKELAYPGSIPANEWLLDDKIMVNNFVCIDDMNLQYYSCYRLKCKIKDHLILTKTGKGLTKKKVSRAIEILTSVNVEAPFDFNEWALSWNMPCDKINCFHKKVKEDKELEESLKRKFQRALRDPVPISKDDNKSDMPSRAKSEPSMPSNVFRSTRPKPKKSDFSSGYDFVL